MKMKAKAHTRALTRSDADATIDFLETAVHIRRLAGARASVDAWLGIDDVACLLRRIRRLGDKLDMPVHVRRELADVMVRASLTLLDGTSRSSGKAVHGHAAQSLSTYWDRYGWDGGKTPVGARAIMRARTGITPEEHARQERIKRLRQLSHGWRDRVARVVAAADGFSREELHAAIDALKQLARKAPRLGEENGRRR